LANYCSNCGEALGSSSTTKGETRKTARKAYEQAKKKRAPSAYNKKYARAYKALKKKHPRTSFAALAKKAHKKAKRMK
jgi:DNA-directed RNA polymerase subunit M/transcription elongation factor TFIIS